MSTRAAFPQRSQGVTLIELMVTVSMLGLFLALSYQPLLRVMSHPRWAQRISRDRSTAVTVERYLLDGLKKTVDGQLWSATTPSATYLLLSQGSSYQGRDKPAPSGYDFFYYDAASERLFRSRFSVDEVHSVTGVLSKTTEISPQGWDALRSSPNRSLVASHLVGFRFEPQSPHEPLLIVLKVSSFPRKKANDPETAGYPEDVPTQTVVREVAQVARPE